MYQNYLKRGLDFLLSLGGIIILSPILLLVALAIKLESKGPIIFTQKRVGKNKKLFQIYKFRTMKVDTPKEMPTHLLDNPDFFITKVGKFLRKTSLDELPQLFNILKGEMAVIGPRPALWNQEDLIEQRDKYEANRVRPGLSGLAQVNGRDELTIEIKSRLDGIYCHKISLLNDVFIIINTIKSIFKSEGVQEGVQQVDFTRENENSQSQILLFSPSFFNYEKKIKEKLEQLGSNVDLYDSRSIKSVFGKMIIKYYPRFFKYKSQRYIKDIILKNIEKKYENIFIIKCDMIEEESLILLKKIYRQAKVKLYLWDSVDNIPNIERKFHLFDESFTFDKEDSEKYKPLKFRPLFFSDEYAKRDDTEYQYDFCFIGTVHSDRYKLLKSIKNQCENKNIQIYDYMYIQSKIVFYLYKIFKKDFIHAKISDFKFEKIDSNKISEVVSRTRVVLDIQHPKQTGLTMRTIEMIGQRKKLITTNASIKKYDFYDNRNIFILDRNQVHIDSDFLKQSYFPIDEDIYKTYSLESWVKELFY